VNPPFLINLGRACLVCQQIEAALGTLLLLERGAKITDTKSFIEELANNHSRTLEWLKDKLGLEGVKYIDFARLDSVIEKRNWLIHRLPFDPHVMAMATGASQDDFAEQARFFLSYYDELRTVLHQRCRELGIDPNAKPNFESDMKNFDVLFAVSDRAKELLGERRERMNPESFPKYLVEIDWRAFDFKPAIPTRPLWVAQTRKPFALALIDATVTRFESDAPTMVVNLWPASLDMELRARAKLMDRLTRQLCYAHELDCGQWQPPEPGVIVPEPPAFIHAVKPGSLRQYLLDPHAPRLWHVRLHDGNLDGFTWLSGFGIAPEFLHEKSRVAAWYRTRMDELENTKL